MSCKLRPDKLGKERDNGPDIRMVEESLASASTFASLTI